MNPVFPESSVRYTFDQLSALDWREEFFDSGIGDWEKHWTLDGLKAEITNDERGMVFRAGPDRKDDGSHAVLWTRRSFPGDIRLDYEYTKLDDAIEAVTILYLQATGSGAEGFPEDISAWADKRSVPAMRLYFRHMHLYHISYAAYDIGNTDPEADYIRARRYLPERPEGLSGTALKPNFPNTGLFIEGLPHRITVIKKGSDLFMWIRSHEHEKLCHWRTDAFPPVTEGRIGLRHMWTRGARYRDFRISTLRH